MSKTIIVADKLQIPKGDFRELDLKSAEYTDSNGKKYSSPTKRFLYSNLLYVPYYSYNEIIEACPEGYRYSKLEETRFLAQREMELKREGKSVKEALNHPLFKELNFFTTMLTHYAIRGIDGHKIGHYIDKDSKGRPYARIDLFDDETLIAEGIKFPVSPTEYNGHGFAIIEWNPVLGIPAVVASNEPEFGMDDEEEHAMHLWLDIEKNEVAIRLTKHFCHVTNCYDFDARTDRSMPKTPYITSNVFVRLVKDDEKVV